MTEIFTSLLALLWSLGKSYKLVFILVNSVKMISIFFEDLKLKN